MKCQILCSVKKKKKEKKISLIYSVLNKLRDWYNFNKIAIYAKQNSQFKPKRKDISQGICLTESCKKNKPSSSLKTM